MAAVVTVKVEEPLPEILVGLNAALAPEGKPLTEKPTVPANPFRAETVTV